MTRPGPEDGHLRMPNWMVERLAKLRLNGTQWQILWAVWRHTMCWQLSGQWGNQPHPIGTLELAEDCGINAHQVKREMGSLVKMNIILRDNTPGGRGHKPITAFNLDPSTWKLPVNSSETATLNKRVTDEIPITEPKGSERVTPEMEEIEPKGSESATEEGTNPLPFTDKSATLSLANSKLGKKQRNIKETPSTKVEGSKPLDPLAALTPASKYLFEKTSRKRWKNLVQKEEFEKVEAQVGEARMKEAIDWALLSGISNIKSILTAAKKGGRRDTTGREQPPGRGSGAHRKDAGEGDRFSGFRAIESGPEQPDDREED